MGIYTKHLPSIITTIIAIIILDQLTKLYVASYPQNTTIFNFAFFKIKYVLNTGAAFSFLTGFNELLKFIVPFAVILLFILLHNYKNNTILRYAFSMEIAGAFGNLIDRFTMNGVIDFIGVGWWPLFNIADSSISIGLTLLIIDLIFKRNKKNE